MIAELIISGLLVFVGTSADGTIWIPEPIIETVPHENAVDTKLETQNSSAGIASSESYNLNIGEKTAEVYPLLGCPSESVADEIQKCLAMIPEDYMNAFSESGWKIQVLDYIPGYASNIVGLTNVNEKTIFIINDAKYAKYIIHEFGHFLEYENIITCDVDIYIEEKDALQVSTGTNIANVSTMLEFYAEGYKWYIVNNELIKENCPKLYNFFNINNPD